MKHVLLWLLCTGLLFSAGAQVLSGNGRLKVLGYRQYLDLAVNNNLLLVAEKYKLAAADARIEMAKVFPNPILSIGEVSGDISGQDLQHQLYAGITQPIPRGGKYRLGVAIARSEKEYQQALYNDYLRMFRLDVTKRFVNMLIAQMAYQKNLKINTLLQVELKKKEKEGVVNEIEIYRIRIEAGQILGQTYQSEEDLKMALYELYVPLSTFRPDTAIVLKGSPDLPFRVFNLDSILPHALDYRTDVVLAKDRYKLSEEHLSLAKANRRKDISIELGNNYYTLATNRIAPTPAYNAITAMVYIPLAFSNFKRGDMQLAELAVKEAISERDHAQNQVRIEISQAYEKYRIAWRQLQLYKDGLLEAADKVLEKEFQNYKEGKTSFLDLSESHRKLDEVYHDYYQALKTYIYAMIELEDDMGIWDIEF